MVAYPKPRGQLGKYGNMTHSAKSEYRKWQTKFRIRFLRLRREPIEKFYCLIYVFYLPIKIGRLPDLDNLEGGINDALTPDKTGFPGWIKDDNISLLNYNVSRAFYKCPKGKIEIIIIDDVEDLIRWIRNNP